MTNYDSRNYGIDIFVCRNFCVQNFIKYRYKTVTYLWLKLIAYTFKKLERYIGLLIPSIAYDPSLFMRVLVTFFLQNSMEQSNSQQQMSEVKAQQNGITKRQKNKWIRFTNIFITRLKQVCVQLAGCAWLLEIDILNMML